MNKKSTTKPKDAQKPPVGARSGPVAELQELYTFMQSNGLEALEQFEALRAAGVVFAQGYLFGQPVTHSELELDSVFLLTKNVA